MTYDEQDVSGDHDNLPWDRKGAGVKVPPPAIFLVSLLAGIMLRRMMPIPLGLPAPLPLLGIFLVVAATVIITHTVITFRRARTAIEPWKPTTTLVYGGCYAFSRNPIYLSFCLYLLGIGILVNSFWIFFSSVPCGFLIYYLAIAREEAYLTMKFGDDYRRYKAKVRRWL